MPTRTVTRTVTVTEPQIRQAVADWLRHRRGSPSRRPACGWAVTGRGRAVAHAVVEVTVEVKENAGEQVVVEAHAVR
jgi:hypothetical protein